LEDLLHRCQKALQVQQSTQVQAQVAQLLTVLKARLVAVLDLLETEQVVLAVIFQADFIYNTMYHPVMPPAFPTHILDQPIVLPNELLSNRLLKAEIRMLKEENQLLTDEITKVPPSSTLHIFTKYIQDTVDGHQADHNILGTNTRKAINLIACLLKGHFLYMYDLFLELCHDSKAYETLAISEEHKRYLFFVLLSNCITKVFGIQYVSWDNFRQSDFHGQLTCTAAHEASTYLEAALLTRAYFYTKKQDYLQFDMLMSILDEWNKFATTDARAYPLPLPINFLLHNPKREERVDYFQPAVIRVRVTVQPGSSGYYRVFFKRQYKQREQKQQDVVAASAAAASSSSSAPPAAEPTKLWSKVATKSTH
jgi:hypothetical protein